MNVRPLIVRELRAEARRAGSYWVRCVAAGILTAVFVWSVWNFAGNANALGEELFRALWGGMVFGVLSIVSALASDSISREKREGTIGLLFLTPLRARDILFGKAMLHGLRALVILLAMLPIAGLPFLLGGIPLLDVLLATMILITAFCTALSSGIIASVYNTHWIQALVWAEILSFGQFFLFFFLETQVGADWDSLAGLLKLLFTLGVVLLQFGFAVRFCLLARSRWRCGESGLWDGVVVALSTAPFFGVPFLISGLPFLKWILFFLTAPVLICFVLNWKRISAMARAPWFAFMLWAEILLVGPFIILVPRHFQWNRA